MSNFDIKNTRAFLLIELKKKKVGMLKIQSNPIQLN